MVDLDKIYKMAEAAKKRLPPLACNSTDVQKDSYYNLDAALLKAHTEKNKLTFAAKHHRTEAGGSLIIASANVLLKSAALVMNQLFDMTRNVKVSVPPKAKDD